MRSQYQKVSSFETWWAWDYPCPKHAQQIDHVLVLRTDWILDFDWMRQLSNYQIFPYRCVATSNTVDYITFVKITFLTSGSLVRYNSKSRYFILTLTLLTEQKLLNPFRLSWIKYILFNVYNTVNPGRMGI